MSCLLDTCVLSELVRPRPDARVTAWVDSQAEASLLLSVVTLGEIRKGIEKLAPGDRRRKLEAWLQEELRPRFAGRILPVSEDVAVEWGRLQGMAERRGEKLPVLDCMLAATAIVHRSTFVTRDMSHLAVTGVSLTDPWAAR